MAITVSPSGQIGSSLLPQQQPAQPAPTTYYQFQQNAGIPAAQNTGINYAPVQSSTPTGGSQNNNTGNDYQAQWTALGRTGSPSVGWHGESGPQSPDMSSQIDALYNPAMDYLNQSEQTLRDNYSGIPGQIQQNYDTNAQLAGTQQSQTNAQLNQTQDQNNYAKESALAASRRLYSELQAGAQQRFGGSTSAGEASNQIIGNEQQRQMGQTNRTYADMAQNVNLAHQKVNDQYNTAIMQLQQNKQDSLLQAKTDFNNKLLDINNMRSQTEQAKANSSLQALQDYRNKLFQVNMTQLQSADILAQQRNQAAAYIGNLTTSLGQYQQSTQGAYQNAINSAGYNMNPTSNTFGNGGGQQTQSNQYVGAINTGQPDYRKFPNDGFSY